MFIAIMSELYISLQEANEAMWFRQITILMMKAKAQGPSAFILDDSKLVFYLDRIFSRSTSGNLIDLDGYFSLDETEFFELSNFSREEKEKSRNQISESTTSLAQHINGLKVCF